MNESQPNALLTELGIEAYGENASSCWFLLEVKPGSKAEEYLVCLLAGGVTETIAGLQYAAECEARSISEALAEFAQVGHCERALQLRLMIKRILRSG